MTALHQAVQDYLALRRRLGVTLHEAGRVLGAFATYADREGAAHVTTDLVLRWAARCPRVSSATLHDRVQMIRRFAQWRQLTDPETDVPRTHLVPGRYRRHPPRLYRHEDIPRLLTSARRLPSATGLRGQTYATLFGLLVVTGLSDVQQLGSLDLGQCSRRECFLELQEQVGTDQQVLRFLCGESEIPEHIASPRRDLQVRLSSHRRLVPHNTGDSCAAACRRSG